VSQRGKFDHFQIFITKSILHINTNVMSWMEHKVLSAFVDKVLHFEAVTLKLRSMSFSHKSRYISHLMRYSNLDWWFGKPDAIDTLWRYDQVALTSISRSIFNRKWETYNFRFLTTIFAVYLWGIVIAGRKWCRNIRKLPHGHHVTFKFGEVLSVKLKFKFMFALSERVPLH